MLHYASNPVRSTRQVCGALDITAKIHEGKSGRRLWAECVARALTTRVKPYSRPLQTASALIPLVVDGKPQAYPTEHHYSNRRFFSFEPAKCTLEVMR